ncbi:MAG TPA: GIY-YIG nuclease family protein [Gammaproteobacteria bacterium]|nr:GIY-YIG nuclease family protein [Gammaproteobacteria bacterium]
MAALNKWHVYIVLCADESLYTGISTDVERRFNEHLTGRGAKYFRGREPLSVVYFSSGYTRSEALQKEAEIKRLSRKEKLMLLDSPLNECRNHLAPGKREKQ